MHATTLSPSRAIFLDALGTLIRLREPWPTLRRLLRERHGVEVELADARRAMLNEMRHYRSNCIRAADESSLGALRLECAGILRAELSLAAPASELVPTLLDALSFEPFDDVIPALRDWRDRELRLYVVSNWDVSLHDVLHGCDLDGLLDGVVCSAELGIAKPDPRIFEAALELARLLPGEVVHIGDSLEEDVIGALAAGIRPFLLRRDTATPAAPSGVATLASLGEL